MNKKVIKAIVLSAAFVLSLALSGYFLNRGGTDMTADIGSATLPGISFEVDGYEINPLAGYVDEMDVTAMRDTIVPVTTEGTLNIHLQANGQKIQGMSFEVYSADGKEKLLERKVKKVKEVVEIDLKKVLDSNSEKVLRTILELQNDRTVSYYTRITSAIEYNVKDCLNFANDFHAKTFDKNSADFITQYIEPNGEGDNTTLQTVTLHSDFDHVTWGDMSLEIIGEVRTSVKETNQTYNGILLEYQVQQKSKDKSGTIYNVKEYIKARYNGGSFYLLDYYRTMNERFNGNEESITNEAVELGMAPEALEYMTSSSAEALAFVQERELWSFAEKENRLALVFSFAEAESYDARNFYDQHSIKIISVEDDGSTAFGVYGYMNRGKHEGEVGAAIYYYDSEKNYVEEKAFIPSNKSFAIAEDDLGKFIYYNRKQDILYVMVEGTFYKINLEENKKETVIENLEEGKYVASEDGSLFAYEDGADVTVVNLSNEKTYTVSAADGESVRPLGFVNRDLVCGRARKADEGKTASEASLTPMYRLEIYNAKKDVIKEYEAENVFIRDVMIEGNMVTLGRVKKSGNSYVNTTAEYISNNEETTEGKAVPESYQSGSKEKQMKLVFADGLSVKGLQVMKPKLALSEKPVQVAFDATAKEGKYYVHGKGALQGIYDSAGYAITKADEVSGVVVTSKQAYVWERGNRMLRYQIKDAKAFTAKEKESSLEACVRQILAMNEKEADVAKAYADGMSTLDILNEYSGGEAVDLTGCTVEEMFYIIGKGTPVIAMTGNDSAVLMVGYDETTVTYIEPSSGRKVTESIKALEQKVRASGNTFIGYVK